MDVACWDREVASVAAQVPVVATEFGPFTLVGKKVPCDGSFDNTWMGWADAHGISYLAHVWFKETEIDAPKGTCSFGLIADWYTGVPRDGHGAAVHDHFAALSAAMGGGRLH
jgi:hypothetical protein